MYTEVTFQEHVIATVRVAVLLACIVLFSIIMTACECKSGNLAKERATVVKSEKVVILDSYPNDPNIIQLSLYRYKVKRIQHGVVTIVGLDELYEKGDTIYCKFKD